MAEAEAWAMVADAHTGIFTTLRSDGVPVALPVWFAALDRAIVIQTRGRKVERVRRDERCSFLVEAGRAWVELRAVHLTGRAEVCEPDEELLARFRREMERKYAAFQVPRRRMPERSREHYRSVPSLIRMVPDDRIVSWDNRRLGVT